ncbi:efflux transporter outer membrane subunit [Pelagicoccus mobilis]|uniref:Efflux transporter outer membrane subunit n=1 Tax=Pelagicoccus mobilis TaxID=415221 RepID=A0A934VR59_9BACT|nr:efflux transporter outer membrane subunit [Pelagicoccus mobilis]MBK1877595.1 efflux transporter outer membrane subunit [Pelagicoccus mobilis]
MLSLLLVSCQTTENIESDVEDAIRSELGNTPQEWAEANLQGEVEVNWIDSFEDPMLATLVEEAQSNNKDLRAAAATVERSRALAVQAGAGLKPAVSLSAGAARSGIAENSSADASSLSVGAQVDWELDLWGRVRSGAQAAAASSAAAEADYRYTQHSIAAATAKAYFANIEANLQLAIAEENLSITGETFRIVKAKEDNGVASAQDIALAKADLASARESLVTLEGARRDASRSLEVLLGRYPSAELEVRDSLPVVPGMPPAGIPSELLERRPDLVAADRRLASAFNALDQAKAARLPRVSLSSNIGGASESLSDLLDPSNVAWRLGANLVAPLFDGGVRKAQVDAATADQKQALAAYASAALKAFQEVEAGLDQGVVLENRIRELSEAEKQSAEAYRIADLRFKEGESELLDLFTFQRRLISIQGNLASLRRLQLDQRVNLHLALGGKW